MKKQANKNSKLDFIAVDSTTLANRANKLTLSSTTHLKQRRKALKDLKDLSLLGIATSLGLGYYIKHKVSNLLDSTLESSLSNSSISLESNITSKNTLDSSFLSYSMAYFTIFIQGQALSFNPKDIESKSELFSLSPKLIFSSELFSLMPFLNTTNPIVLIQDSPFSNTLLNQVKALESNGVESSNLAFLNAVLNSQISTNTNLAKKHIIDFLRRNIKVVSLNKFHTQSDSIFKEAYCKVLHYIGSAQGEHTEFLAKRIPSIATKIKEFFNPEALMDTENLIRTKIKKASNLSNDDENFEASKAMKYSRDFLIQLKRVAEYNYLVYSGEFREETNNNKTTSNANVYGINKNITKKETDLLGNLIYDKEFIPTTIDVKD